MAGRIDAVVDCVAAGPRRRLAGRFAETDPAGYAAFLDLSVGHVERLAHAALPALSRRGGTFVALVSDAGLFAAPGQAVIGAARAATIGFVRNLAVEIAAAGVRAHCVSMTFADGTAAADRLPPASARRLERARGRAGLGLPTAADVAEAVLFLSATARAG